MITPFLLMYALHDAMVKPMPGNAAEPCLAESWKMAPDGLSYEFILRAGAKFHDGSPVTAEDVKFSFERYRGTSAALMKERVAAVETPDERSVRFVLKKPWPDFVTFYSSATGAGWIVPKKYVQQVGEDGFKKAPIGAGPYKFVSFTPGVELVMEAFEGYWRKAPTVKKLVWKVIPDEATRLAALKRGEVDLAYSIRGELAEELRRTPGLELKPVVINAPFWIYFADQWDPKSPWHDARVRKALAHAINRDKILDEVFRGELGKEVQRTPGLTLKPTVIQSTHFAYFADQWDPKSPWHDRRVRLAANLAIDRQAINQAVTLGFSKITHSIIPSTFDFYWQPPLYPYDPARARQLLAEAGYPNGFDAGEYFCDLVATNSGEVVVTYLKAVGIGLKLRPLERAAFFKGFAEKKFKNIIHVFGGVFGNAATRLEAFVVGGGTYVYGSYPDLDGLFREQAAELDRAKREAVLHRMQQLVHEKAIFAPIWELAFLNGVGPRVEESGLGLIAGYAYSAPYEDLKLKGR